MRPVNLHIEDRGGSGPEVEHLLPHGLDIRGCEHNEITRLRAVETDVRSLVLVQNARNFLFRETSFQRTLSQQCDDLTGSSPATGRILTEDDLVEVARGQSPHLPHVVVATVARDVDHSDDAPMAVTHLEDQISQGLKACRVVGIVQDDPEAMAVEDIETSGALLER